MPSPNFTVRLKSREGGLSEDGHRSYTVVYQVESDSLNVSPALIDAAIGVPYYAPYPTDPAARLKRKNVSQEGSELYFHRVSHEYDTKPSANDRGTVQAGEPGSEPGNPGMNSGNTSPIDRPWVLKWGSVWSEKIAEKDKDGKDCLNSAGQPFDPPITYAVARPTLSLTAIRLSAQVDKIYRYVNKVNRQPFLGAPAGHARVTSYGVSSIFELNAYYWQVDVTVEFSEEPWNPRKILDAGTVERTFDDQNNITGYRAIIDRLGSPVASPVPLDGKGKALKKNPFGSPFKFEYIDFRFYDEDDFSQLI